MSKFYITTPIYYVNSKPHIGHAYTTIAADVLARYNRMIGNDTHFLTGTDEHGEKIACSAEEVSKDVKTFVDEISAQYQNTWDSLNISNDIFYRTTSDKHKEGVVKFMNVLQNAGVLYKDKYEGLYCTGCEKFITKKELVDGKCPDHNKVPKNIVEENYFFRLTDYLDKVKKLIEEDEIKIYPESAKKETLGLFKQNLKDISVTRENVEWGIKLPFDQSQTIYVWVEALQNYITVHGYDSTKKDHEKYWPANVHMIGKDILKFHAIYWPAMLLAAGEKLPEAIFVHGYFTIDGQKMSGTIGNVINPNDLVKDYGTDGARFLIISQFPFGQDGDVKAEKFEEQYNAELANNLGNLVSRVVNLSQGVLQESDYDKKLEKKVSVAWDNYHNAMKIFRIDQALGSVSDFINFLNKYIDEKKPWEVKKTDQKKFGALMQGLSECLRHIGWMIRPYLPETSDKILNQLGVLDEEKKQNLGEIIKWKEIDFSKIKKGEILFPKN